MNPTNESHLKKNLSLTELHIDKRASNVPAYPY